MSGIRGDIGKYIGRLSDELKSEGFSHTEAAMVGMTLFMCELDELPRAERAVAIGSALEMLGQRLGGGKAAAQLARGH